jgi:hypothetical protein
VTLDGHRPSHSALRLLRREDPQWRYVRVRSCPYLNDIIEQDHRVIKRRCAPDDELQVVSKCSHHARSNGAGASNSKAAVLFRARPSLAGTVTQTALGPSLSLETRYFIQRTGSSWATADASEPRRACSSSVKPKLPVSQLSSVSLPNACHRLNVDPCLRINSRHGAYRTEQNLRPRSVEQGTQSRATCRSAPQREASDRRDSDRTAAARDRSRRSAGASRQARHSKGHDCAGDAVVRTNAWERAFWAHDIQTRRFKLMRNVEPNSSRGGKGNAV